jgi:RecB family exonuclease
MTNPARQSKALAELDALQIALNDLRFEYARGNVYCDTPVVCVLFGVLFTAEPTRQSSRCSS